MQCRIEVGRHDRQLLPHDIAAHITHLRGQLRKGLDQMIQDGQRFDDLVPVRTDEHWHLSHRVSLGKLVCLAVRIGYPDKFVVNASFLKKTFGEERSGKRPPHDLIFCHDGPLQCDISQNLGNRLPRLTR